MIKLKARYIVLSALVFALCCAALSAHASVAERYIKQGLFNEARDYLNARPHQAYHKHHLEGLIARQLRELDRAEAEFRKALALNPDFKPAKRELAKTLFLAGNYDGAEHHFKALSSSSVSEAEQQGYDRFLEAIKAKRPWGISGFFGFLPSTNVNRGTENLTVSTVNGDAFINSESQEQSGLGVTVGLSGYYRMDLDKNNLLLFSGSLGGVFYEDNTFNSANVILNTEFGKTGKKGSVFLGGTYAYTLSDFNTDDDNSGGNKSNQRFGVTVRGTRKLGKQTRLVFSARALRQLFSANNDRDGYFFSASLNLERALSQTTSVFSSIGFKREDADREDLSHNDWSFAAGFNKTWKGGIQTSLYGGYENHRYDENFLLTNRLREDDQFFVGGSVLNPAFSINGFAPKLTYKYTTQDSTIEFFEYDAHDVGLIWTKKF